MGRLIVVRVIGGLGNQLFQYATGRALALRRGVPFGLDTRIYDRPGVRALGLGEFNIQTLPVDLTRLPIRSRSNLLKFLSSLRPGVVHTYREPRDRFDFNPKLLDQPDWTYLKGYFMSEKYFVDYEEEIRRDLSFRNPPEGENADALKRIRSVQSVSVHIRRGDVLDSDNAYVSLDLDYHRRAADYVAGKLGTEPTFFVFSDDAEWVAENFRLPYPMEVVTHNGDARNTEDLRLMSNCRHHINANSTFSWWGAWLDAARDNIVVAPKVWFRDPTISTRTMYPERWAQL